METKQIELEWGKVDWSKLNTTHSEWIDNSVRLFVGMKDIEEFIADICRELYYQTGIPYEEIEKMVNNQNWSFNEVKEAIFDKGKRGYRPDDEQLQILLEMFIAPRIAVKLN